VGRPALAHLPTGASITAVSPGHKSPAGAHQQDCRRWRSMVAPGESAQSRKIAADRAVTRVDTRRYPPTYHVKDIQAVKDGRRVGSPASCFVSRPLLDRLEHVGTRARTTAVQLLRPLRGDRRAATSCAIAHMKPTSSRAIGVQTTVVFLPRRLSARCRAVKRDCAFHAISRILRGTCANL
jgi:hypothetical protein